MNFWCKTRKFTAYTVGILSVLAVSGVPVQKIMYIQFIPLLQKVLTDFSVFSLILFSLLIILTLLFGRFYCSTVCPLGIYQEVITDLNNNSRQTTIKNYGYKYLICTLVFGSLLGGSAILARLADPYTIFSSALTFSAFGIITALLIGILAYYKKRVFCTNICPVGAVLGLISKLSLNKIYIKKENCVSCGKCLNFCPSGCIDINTKTVDNENCLKCLNCLSVCKKEAIRYGNMKQEQKFSPKRRQFILGMATLGLFGIAYSAGLNFCKAAVQKVKNVILPAGAQNTKKMAEKCLKCNLCINSCPNKILTKADENFSAVHIDYEKGYGFCDYNCKACSDVCPAGAIKKLSLKEKQNTQIAIAKLSDNCIKCGHCLHACPKGAISGMKGNITIDPSKCIGCGKCKRVCKADAIKLYAVNEQKII